MEHRSEYLNQGYGGMMKVGPGWRWALLLVIDKYDLFDHSKQIMDVKRWRIYHPGTSWIANIEYRGTTLRDDEHT